MEGFHRLPRAERLDRVKQLCGLADEDLRVLTGETPLAPAWMRKAGLEWVYRLIRQPRRWRRILVAVPLFLWAVLHEGRPVDA